MNPRRPRLAFVSPVFLFPNDAGGKIRTTNILRGLKGGIFDITLLCPAAAAEIQDWRVQIDGVCDQFIPWQPAWAKPRWLRAVDVAKSLPVNVEVDRTRAGLQAVRSLCQRRDVDLVVFDFVHSAVLLPRVPPWPTLCFTHNVEAEIFSRHATQARGISHRWLWSSQHRKMQRFEGDALRRFDRVIAVSERDAHWFKQAYGLAAVDAIPTGVDLEFFAWREPRTNGEGPPTVVFTGSMDWAANIDGVSFFLREVWPRVLAACPEACFKVVGRDPPASLRSQAQQLSGVSFTGFVDDVRPHVQAAHAFAIPLLVGGGTRIKAYEAMAMGCPVVSTAIGTEGLEVEPDTHYLMRDSAAELAEGVLLLLRDGGLRQRLSCSARRLVATRFGHRAVAAVFEDVCRRTLVAERYQVAA